MPRSNVTGAGRLVVEPMGVIVGLYDVSTAAGEILLTITAEQAHDLAGQLAELFPGGRPWHELRSSGLLWWINRVAFHPIGRMFGVNYDEHGRGTGWELFGGPVEPYTFDVDEERVLGPAAWRTLGLYRDPARPVDPPAADP